MPKPSETKWGEQQSLLPDQGQVMPQAMGLAAESAGKLKAMFEGGEASMLDIMNEYKVLVSHVVGITNGFRIIALHNLMREGEDGQEGDPPRPKGVGEQ